MTGLLYPPGDGAALAAAVDRLVGDRGLRGRLRAAAVRSVQVRSWHAINEQLIGHYRAVVAERDGLLVS